MASCNCKPPWSTKAFFGTIHEIEHHDVVNSGMFADGVCDKRTKQRTKQPVRTFEKAMESYMVEVIPDSHFICSN